MKNRMQMFRVISLSLLLVCLVAGGLSIASAGQDEPRRPRSPLGFLKHALEEASAPALTTQQEEQLTALITSFHESRKAQGPNEAVRSAHEAYDAAVLSGNESAAQAQAAAFASAMATSNAERLKAEATFKIAALGILTPAQKSAIGNDLLPRVLNSLAGGPAGIGGPVRGPGRMGPPPDGAAPPPGMRRRPGN